MNKKDSRLLELIRFIVCGVIATLIDYLFSQLIILVLPNSLNEYLVIAFSTTVGFVTSIIANYFISTYWVYRNVDQDVKTKSPLFITLFVILSLCAMLLGIGIMSLCNLFVGLIWGEGNDIVNLSVMSLIKENGIAFLGQFIFWAYAISFIIKTIITLAFNYFTRKYILYKEPKKTVNN